MVRDFSLFEASKRPISVQDDNCRILFQNSEMRKLFPLPVRHCFESFGITKTECAGWNALMNGGRSISVGRFHRDDGYVYLKITGSVIKVSGKSYLLEELELLDYFPEFGVSEDMIIPVFVKFGLTGGEMVAGCDLNFVNTDTYSFITMMAAYWISALGQGDHLNEGMYGPLPVLDYNNWLSYGISRIMTSADGDVRFGGNEYTVLLLFVRYDLEGAFTERTVIHKIIHNTLSKISDVKDMNDQILKKIRNDLIGFLKSKYRVNSYFKTHFSLDSPSRQ